MNKIISNPPFHIISPLLFRLARKYFISDTFELCVLIVQLDYAKKMCAPPGEKRSRLSATIQYYADVELLSIVSRKNFFPPPEVDTAIVRLRPRRTKHMVDFSSYERTVRILFNMPNKTLRKVIKKYFKDRSPTILEQLVQRKINVRKHVRELSNMEIEIIADLLKEFLD